MKPYFQLFSISHFCSAVSSCFSSSIFQGVRTMTANIVMEMGYAAGLHREALIATGVVLFVLSC